MSSHVYVKGDDAGGWRQEVCARVQEGVREPDCRRTEVEDGRRCAGCLIRVDGDHENTVGGLGIVRKRRWRGLGIV